MYVLLLTILCVIGYAIIFAFAGLRELVETGRYLDIFVLGFAGFLLYLAGVFSERFKQSRARK